MGARRQAFRQADVTRVVKGASAGGQRVSRVEVDREGKIVVHFGEPEKEAPVDEFERWMAGRRVHAS